jgi:hypothetical protein
MTTNMTSPVGQVVKLHPPVFIAFIGRQTHARQDAIPPNDLNISGSPSPAA